MFYIHISNHYPALANETSFSHFSIFSKLTDSKILQNIQTVVSKFLMYQSFFKLIKGFTSIIDMFSGQ